MNHFIFSVYSLILFAVFSVHSFNPALDDEWTSFKETYGRSYESKEIDLERREIWESNVEYIENHNREAELGKHTFKLKMNKFGDLSNLEFQKIHFGFNKTKNMNQPSGGYVFPLPMDWARPSSYDLRQNGYLLTVKDQGNCASDWAFSAIDALQGQYFKNYDQTQQLSEQDVIDCSKIYGSLGCDGGLMTQAFFYSKSVEKIECENSYPYKGIDQKCNLDKNKKDAEFDFVYHYIMPGEESDLAAAIVLSGPVAVAIDASKRSFQFYSSGIYIENECSSTDLNHAMVAIGYDSLGKGQDFFIVKNSFGTSWGHDGYIKIARNKNNMCGISSAASIPIV